MRNNSVGADAEGMVTRGSVSHKDRAKGEWRRMAELLSLSQQVAGYPVCLESSEHWAGAGKG